MAGCDGLFFSPRKPIAAFVYETYVATGEVRASLLVEAGYLNRVDAEKVTQTFEDGKYDVSGADFHRMNDYAYKRNWFGTLVMRKDFEALIALGNRPVKTRVANLIKIISTYTKSSGEVKSAMDGLLAISGFTDQSEDEFDTGGHGFNEAFYTGLCHYPSLYDTAVSIFSEIKNNENVNIYSVEKLEGLANNQELPLEIRMNAAKVLYQLYNRGSHIISIFLNPTTNQEIKNSLLKFLVKNDNLDAFGPNHYRYQYPQFFDTLFSTFKSSDSYSYYAGVALKKLATPEDAEKYASRLVSFVSQDQDDCKVSQALDILVEMKAKQALPVLREIKKQIPQDDSSEVGCNPLYQNLKSEKIGWAISQLEKL